MRLLKASTLEIEEFTDDQIPQYAILSHRWSKEELSFQDVQAGVLVGRGFGGDGLDKVREFSSRAQSDGFEYAWIDTCCINKTSSAELSEAINSMYFWYYKAERCYAYLADVRSIDEIRESKWFTRGWTLQELLAPSEVFFYSKSWDYLGTKTTLQLDISSLTGIPTDILSGDNDLESASIAQRMLWAAKRETTRLEDRAYSLMGIFGINMPLVYGEGERAFTRLQEEIIKISDDHSLFAWEHGDNHSGLLATTPAVFESSGNIIQSGGSDSPSNPTTVSSRGVHLELRFMGIGPRGLGLAILNCEERDSKDRPIAIYVRDISLTMERFERVCGAKLERLDLGKYRLSQYPIRRLCIQKGRLLPTWKSKKVTKIYGAAELIIYDDKTLLEMLSFAEPKALFYAAQAGFEDKVWLLLSRSDICVNFQDNGGRTELSHAAEHCHVAVVKMLLPRSNIEAKDNDGRTPLSWAARMGHESVVKLLLEKGANVETKDNSGQTPLIYAVVEGREAVVKLLLEKGVVNDGRTPLLFAAKMGHETVVKLLLDKGADIEVKDGEGKTPLFLAAVFGHRAAVTTLLENGANIEAESKNGQTLLSSAVVMGHDSIVKVLLEKGANVEARNKNGQTPLSLAAKMGYEAVTTLLLEKGSDIDVKDNDGRTPLSWAAKMGNDAVVRLLRKGAGRTPPSLAAMRGLDNVAKLIGRKA